MVRTSSKMYEIFRFEFVERIKSPSTWIYFIIVFFMSLFSVDFVYEGRLGPIIENAPYVIAVSMSVVSSFLMVICSLVMGMSILRDFECNIQSILFVTPFNKSEYLIGRFMGSFLILIIIISGLFWGIAVSELLPWRDEDQMLPFKVWHYLQPFIFIILPTMFFSGAIFFTSGALSKKLVVVYIQGLAFLMFYLFSLVLSRGDDGSVNLSQILDPFMFQTIKAVISEWGINERNLNMLPMAGFMIFNRFFWISIGILVLIYGYFRFQFTSYTSIAKSKSIAPTLTSRSQNISSLLKIPQGIIVDNWTSKMIQLKSVMLFHLKMILKEPLFITILVSAILTIVINSINLDTNFGIDSFPTTYLVLEQLQELSLVFFLMILIYYAGDLVWKERDIRIDSITHSLPASNVVVVLGKLFSIILIYVVLIIVLILSGIIFQTLNVFFEFNISLYLTFFFVEILPFLWMFTVAAIFIQVLVNHKFLGYIFFILFFIVRIAIEVGGVAHPLYTYGTGGLGMYSDMNGYGHFVIPFLWLLLYWFSASIILLMMSIMFLVRGKESNLKMRFKSGIQNMSNHLKYVALGAFVILGFSGAFIFYNTNILNDFTLPITEYELRAKYEKSYKKYEYINQPEIVDVYLDLQLESNDRNYMLNGHYILLNKDSVSISDIHVQVMPSKLITLDSLKFSKASKDIFEDEEFNYHIYHLQNPLMPGDSIIMSFQQSYLTNGFVLDDNTDLVYNGTFINNDHFPSIGYNSNIELSEDYLRKDYELPNVRKKSLDDANELTDNRGGGDGDFINFEIKIATDKNQTAIAPGVLLDQNSDSSKNYFHYKCEVPIINFYDIVSAQYEVERDQWISEEGKAIDLEVYYHNGHGYNVDRMLKGMKSSLDYYSRIFGNYDYKYARIMEIPRYRSFAQSYPGTIPFAESIGFIMDIQEGDVDMAFFITAHEMAHQWWGLKLLAANVEGKNFIIESLAQYSALMVLKHSYGDKKVDQFLRAESKKYFQEKGWAKDYEKALINVEGEEFIYYQKGAINLYALQSYIGEEKMNKAIKQLLLDWSGRDVLKEKGRYSISTDLVNVLSDVTPDSLQYVIDDMYNTITYYDNKILNCKISSVNETKFILESTVVFKKFLVDSMGMDSPMKFNDFTDIGVYGMNSEGQEILLKMHHAQISNDTTLFKMTLNQIPTKIVLDPLLKMLDKDLNDNTVSL